MIAISFDRQAFLYTGSQDEKSGKVQTSLSIDNKSHSLVCKIRNILLTDITIYDINIMIRSFADKFTRDIYDGTESRFSRKLHPSLHKKAQRILDQINAAHFLEFLRIPPGNHLEKLSGKLSNFWSLRINAQWRIIFRWKDDDAYDVQIIDYH